MISCFQGKSFKIMVIQVYAPTSNAEEAEVEWFYENLQDLLELTTKKVVLFITGDWNAKLESQEIPGVTRKFHPLIILRASRPNQSDFGVDHLVMFMCRSSLVLLEEGVCYDQCVLLAKLF